MPYKQGKKEKKETIFITGATGFIGVNLVNFLMKSDKKYGVIACVRSKEKAYHIFADFINNQRLQIVQYSMAEEIDISEDVEYVVHAAANTSKEDMKCFPTRVLEENIQGCIRVLEFAKKKLVKKFLLLSTAQVYGDLLDAGCLKEDFYGGGNTLNTFECYAQSKRSVENLTVAYGKEYGLNISIIRLFSVYGPGMNFNSGTVFVELFKNALEGQQLTIRGTGKGIRNWTYIDDIVKAILMVLLNKTDSIVYNVGNSEGNVSILELAQTLQKIKNSREDICIRAELDNTTRESIQTPDLEKITNLGFKPMVSLEEGIQNMMKYYKVNKVMDTYSSR